MPFFDIKYKELERRMFLRTIVVSLLAILLYIAYDVWAGNYGEKLTSAFWGFGVFSVCLLITLYVRNLIFVIYFDSMVFITSIIASFFQMNGFQGVFSLDLLNLYLCVGLMTSGNVRKYGISFCLMLTFVSVYIQLQRTDLISNIRYGDPAIVSLFFLSLRFLLTLSLGMAVKEEYEKEKSIISSLNEDLTSKNEEIQRINNELELSVSSRTKEVLEQNQKMIEFAFYNTHNNNTSSLARLLELVYVLNIVKPDIDWKKYNSKLNESTKDIEEMIKKIDIVLQEGLLKPGKNQK